MDAAWKHAKEMFRDLVASLPNIALALVLLFIFFLVAKGVSFAVRRTLRFKNRSLGIVMGRLAGGLIIFVGLLMGLGIVFPSVDAQTLLGLLGVSSVAIGFAFRDILQNFLAGIIVLFTEPFRIDDQIVVKDFEGTVEDIRIRATAIRTYDGRRAIIPNGDMLTSVVMVNTAYEHRRMEYDIGIGYGDDIAKAQRLILEAIAESGAALDAPKPDALVVGLAGSSVNIRARWWIIPPRRIDALDSQSAVLHAIKNKLIANGIDLPFPTQQVLFHDQTEDTDGDRSRQREGWPAGQNSFPKPRPLSGRFNRSDE